MMRTQLMLERAVGMPWLERDSADGGPPEQTPLSGFPFTLGRGESADLVVDSGRVSREHAMILQSGGEYRLRDLGSTNGTFVNGQRIEESLLGDGDIFVLADVEFTFFAGRQSPQEMATQVMGGRRAEMGGRESATQLIREVRRRHEMLTHRAVEVCFEPVVRLADGAAFGYEAVEEAGVGQAEASPAERLLLGTECRLLARLRHLRRMVAVEEAAAFPPGASVFLKLDASEIGSPGLAESLERLHGALGDVRPLVVEVPDSAVSDTRYYREFRGRMEALEVGIAHGDFSAGPAQLVQQEQVRPDFVKLARPLVHALDRSRQRQQQVQSLVEAAGRIGCEIVAVGVRTAEEEEVCRQLGCRYAQGERFGGPQPALLLARCGCG